MRLTESSAPPIDDPFKEKDLIEGSGWYEYLRKRTGASSIVIRPEMIKARVVEVYRQCYERSGNKKNLGVLKDFIAFHPGYGFDAPWLADLCRQAALHLDLNTSSAPNRLLMALANGFRRAAEPQPRMMHRLRVARLGSAWGFRKEMRKRLRQFDQTIDRKYATPDWIEEQSRREAQELVKEHPRLKPSSSKLEKLLRRGQLYEAATLIAATVYGVRKRDLESKPS